MQRVLGVLGGIALALVVVGVFVATEIDFGDDGTLASRVPVVGDLVESSLRAGPGGPGPMIRLEGERPTCARIYSLSIDERVELGTRIAKRWSESSSESVSGAQLAQAFALACQQAPPSEKADTALFALLSAVEDGTDPTGAICEAFRRDFAKIEPAAGAAGRASRALQSAVEESRFGETYELLVRARAQSRTAAATLRTTATETHSGSRVMILLADLETDLATAYGHWLGAAKSSDAWLAGPAEKGISGWYDDMERLSKRFQKAGSNPDLLPFPAGEGCDVDVASLGG